MKSRSRKHTPNIVNLTVRRRYLTEREVERLMDCARKYGRYGHRDATMILVAYRHGLRASEVCNLQWQQIELSEGRLHVHRVKNGIPSVHPIRAVTRCGRFASSGAITLERLMYSFPSAAGHSVLLASTGSSSASARLPRCLSRSTHTCCAMPVVLSSPTMATTHGLCSTTSATGTSSTRSDTPKWPPTGSRTFGEADLRASLCRRFRAPASSGRLPLPLQSPWHSRQLPVAPTFPRSAPATARAARRSSLSPRRIARLASRAEPIRPAISRTPLDCSSLPCQWLSPRHGGRPCAAPRWSRR